MEITDILVPAVLLLTIALWVWALVDLSKSRFKSGRTNLLWLLIILFSPIIGSILYFQLKKGFTERRPRQFEPKFN
ncbi:PLDc N-terminal domain-containing protein [Roseivirga sp.]|uniref:PLDc N-terminal domain-containing protein n=1 Tax=Roseivirga sp. TaxID=1964215 RepID=UPI003A5C7EB8